MVPFLSKQVLARVEAREARESQKSIEDANMLEFGSKQGRQMCHDYALYF
jgi:hypothetical protein